MTAALHVTRLPDFATSWPDEVCSIVEAKLGGEIDPQDLRTIVLAPVADGLRLGVSLGVEWKDNPYADGHEAGFVSLTPWLDLVDAVARGELALPGPTGWQPWRTVRFTDAARDAAFAACWSELHDAIVATAIEVATQRLAGRFEQLVGVFASLSNYRTPVVAFCHPRGAPLWALRENRKEHGYDSAYPQASMRDRQLTIFYPEGEGVTAGPPAIRTWKRDDIVRASRKRNHVTVWFANEAFPVAFSGGYTRADEGGPTKEQVVTALVDLCCEFGVFVDGAPATPELPVDVEAFEAALAGLPDEIDRLQLVAELAQAYGIATIGALVEYATMPPKARGLAHRRLADVALDAGDWAGAYAHIDRVTGDDRWSWMELRALVGLGRWEAVLAVAEDDDRAERALALHALGRADEAVAAIGTSTDTEELLVRALIEVERDVETALATLRLGLPASRRSHVFLYVEAEPRFATELAAQRAFEAEVAASREAAAAIAAAPLDVAAARVLRVPVPTFALGTPLAERDAGPSYDVVLRRAEAWWLADSTGGLVEATPGEAARPLATFAARVGAMVEAPAGVVVRTGARISLLDAGGTTRAQTIPRAQGDGPLAARGAVVASAHDDVVILYDAALSPLGCVAIPGERNVSGLAFVAADRLLIAASQQLLLVDAGDPARPVVRRRWAGDYTLVHATDGRVVLGAGNTAFVVEVSGDELRPAIAIPTEATPEWVHVPGKLGIGWRGHVAIIGGERVSHGVVFGADGAAIEPRALALGAGSAIAATERGLETLVPLPFDAPAIEAAVEALVPRAREWLFRRLDEISRGDEALGGVWIDWRKEWVGLYALPACSVVVTSGGIRDSLGFEGDASEDDPEDLSDADRERRDSLRQFGEQVAQHARARASRALAGEIVARYRGKLKARTLFVAYKTVRELEIVSVVDGGGPQLPRRAPGSASAPQSLERLMGGSCWYSSVSTWVARAKRDAEFRGDVLALLAGKQLEAAAAVALELIDVDHEACARAFLAAADRDLDVAFVGLAAVASRGHVEARDALRALIDHEVHGFALAARVALGRVDEDATVPILRAELVAIADADELPRRTLAALSDGRLAQVIDALQAAHDRLRDDSLLVPLVRAGWTPDAATIAKGNRERARESDFLAPTFDNAIDDTAQAVRAWIARRIADALDADGPLWPAEVPLETARIGWRHLFELAWPCWEGRAIMDRLRAELPRRAAVSSNDAELAFQVLCQHLLHGSPHATELRTALEAVPYEEGTREKLIAMARHARLQLGWSLIEAQRYAEARPIADAVVADAPGDGQGHVFAARLAWVERDDPQAAIDRIGPALATTEDAVGRARLLNLHGAALDALGRIADAVPLFRQALAVNEAAMNFDTGAPADPAMSASILSNLAEAHWKLGDRAEATKHAEQAQRRGSSTAIVAEILAAARATS